MRSLVSGIITVVLIVICVFVFFGGDFAAFCLWVWEGCLWLLYKAYDFLMDNPIARKILGPGV